MPKNHTIRSGNRWKVGDWFSPRIWSGKPYRSPQTTIYDDVEVKKVWDFEIGEEGRFIGINGKRLTPTELEALAGNDALMYQDFLRWFQYPKPFKGQIICWNENVEY